MPKYRITISEKMEECEDWYIDAEDEEAAQETALLLARKGRAWPDSYLDIEDSKELEEDENDEMPALQIATA